MKTPRSDSDARWEKLLRAAQADAGPPADLPALLRVVRPARPSFREGWVAEFTTLFASARVAASCLVATAVFAGLGGWEIWDVWQTLPWVQLLAAVTGGAP